MIVADIKMKGQLMTMRRHGKGMKYLFFAVALSFQAASCSVIEKAPMTHTGAAIQAAIDAVHNAGGGTVKLERAVYPSGTLYLKSNVTLVVPEGAVILGGDNASCYDDVIDSRIGKSPEKSNKVFISCLFQTNVCITGGGVIDGQGPGFYDTNTTARMYAKPKAPRTRMIQFVGCRNVRFSDITFKDSPGWTCWMRMCENLEFERVKIHADQKMINNDGFHIDGCRKIRIRNCDLRTGDDCIVMRSIISPNGDSALCEDMIVEDCTLSSNCQAIRLGCPSDGTIRNGIFRRLKIRGFNGVVSMNPVRYLQDGDHGNLAMENILVEDCDIDVTSGPLTFFVESGIKLRSFGNTTFRNLKIKGTRPIRIQGNGFTQVENIRFENIKGELQCPEAITVNSAKGIAFDGFEVSTAMPKGEKLSVNTSDGWERVR